jgi:lipid-A-disaccharide synthase
MQAAGMDIWYPAETLSVLGFVEVLGRLPEILTVRRQLRARLIAEPPDLFVGVDAPDFNLGLEESLRRTGIRTVHFVGPSIWAWRRERIHRIKRAVDRILVLFPFEPPIYEQAGIPVSFVGHPLADMLPYEPDREGAREQFRLGSARTVIALLPGSRQNELKYLGDLFAQTAKLMHRRVNDVHFLVPLISRHTRRMFEDVLYRNEASELPMTLLFGHAHLAMTAADGVLLASGTAALEAALIKRPMVVTYRGPRLSYAIARSKVYLPYASLPNVLAGRFVVPEIYQDEATPEVLCQALLNAIGDKEVRARQTREFQAIHASLQQDSRLRISEALLPLLSSGAARPDARSMAGAEISGA